MKYFYIFLFFFAFDAVAQKLSVEYDVKINDTKHRYELENYNGASIQKRYSKTLHSDKSIENKSVKVINTKIGPDTTIVFKDFIAEKLYSKEAIFTKVFDVEDNLKLFDWKIHDDTLTILNKKCHRATALFRGREYEAYFAESIPVSDGPSKFNGLPGLILKVSIINSNIVYVAEAVKLKVEQEGKPLTNPYQVKKTISFTQFKKSYNRKYDELEAYNKLNNTGVVNPRGGLEILTDE